MSVLAVGILAGGRGSRMGGVDKGWLPRGDVAQVQWLLPRLGLPPGTRVAIVANRNQERYRAVCSTVVADPAGFGDFPGPLAGLLGLFDALPQTCLLSIPVDLESVPAQLWPRFAGACASAPDACHVARDVDGLQPLVAAYPAAAAEAARAALQGGERSVRDWQRSLPLRELDFRPQRFGNLNEPGQWPH